MSNKEGRGSGETPVLVVIGATGGIGSELCQRLAAQGTRLVMAGRNAERLHALADEVGALPMVLDATCSDAVNQCFADVLAEYGRVDGVANCVGSLLLKPAHLTSDEEWNETLTTNLTSAFVTVRAAARAMMKTGGSIVLVSKGSMALHPLGRIGEPADVAAAIEWFLDPAQNWVTGQVLGVDGGLGSLRTRGSA
ncbi:MAG: SDR family NAD(P)-dependent oxidoreductase [Candidatus Binatia bacterium]